MMEFRRLAPWPQAVPMIEIESGDSRLDLHNWADFTGLRFDAPESLTFSFRYSRPEDDVDLIRLRFDPVRDLSIVQAPDFEPRVVGDLESFLWQGLGAGWGRVEFRFGDLVVTFRARMVELVPPP
jgi:hypothetical protein